jgi:hypothetical protein
MRDGRLRQNQDGPVKLHAILGARSIAKEHIPCVLSVRESCLPVVVFR